MTKTNIKNLPAGEYFTECMWSDSHAWVVVSRTAKTIKVAAVEVDADPEWKAKQIFHVGGFCGHMENQNEQTWVFARVRDDITRTIRMTKRGWASHGTRYMEGVAREFHDYNF